MCHVLGKLWHEGSVSEYPELRRRQPAALGHSSRVAGAASGHDGQEVARRIAPTMEAEVPSTRTAGTWRASIGGICCATTAGRRRGRSGPIGGPCPCWFTLGDTGTRAGTCRRRGDRENLFLSFLLGVQSVAK